MDNGSVEAALVDCGRVFNRIDEQKRLTLTGDQRREMAMHQQLTQATGVKVYFADLHSP